MTRSPILAGLGFVAGTAAAVVPAGAHHSYVVFDPRIEYLAEAVVIDVRFVSPHAEFVLAIAGNDGQWERWTIEGAASGALLGQGMAATTLRPGDRVQLTYCVRRDGTPVGHGGWLRQTATADGRLFDMDAVYVLSSGGCRGTNFDEWQDWIALGARTNLEGQALQAAEAAGSP